MLDEYYGKYVKEFRRMVDKFEITLPKNVCCDLSENMLNRMVDMAIKMERPLTNALGEDWRGYLTIEKIKNLYLAM